MDGEKLIRASDARKAILNIDPKSAYCIDSIPAVDAVKVVHGRWISLSALWGEKSICSVCGRDLYVNEPGNGLPNIEDLHYCPNCGAKMDLEEKRHEIF